MNAVEDFILERSGDQKDLLLYFHLLFTEKCNLDNKIAYGIPFYYFRKKWVVYLNPDKRKGVEVGFPNGHKMKDPSGALMSKGRKIVKSLELNRLDEVQEELMLD
ncbi:MAG: hypothetical protein CMO34_03640 [Verrucomicrobia bacterium]|nr:hypothetical protein [Verrucomicrobiota bacterium]|tara:strand:- start:56 stop:370 length:315 start_codon:yes stop_codon:yes gene_type:complete